uniref:Thrombomodulin n=1 Tax=Latimeria chalumnae TaxID=7897 RepID=H3BES4_LATCH
TMFSVLASVLTIAQFALLEALSQADRAVCIANECYAIYSTPIEFNQANSICASKKGGLVTVRTTVASEAISVLQHNLAQAEGEFWIGLQLPEGKCVDSSTKLRGYQWVTGDESTDYTNWKENDSSACGPMCVAVSSNQTWVEKPCNAAVSGFLCGYSYAEMCPRLSELDDISVIYNTPFGIEGKDFLELPPDTVAVTLLHPSEFRCSDTGNGKLGWKSFNKDPWDCRIENGGCEYSCEVLNNKPQCTCPLGKGLNEDQFTCSTSPDFCASSPCHHLCVNYNHSFLCMCRDGFELTDDGRTCKDIDDCRRNPGICDQRCINTEGAFRCECNLGYKLKRNKCYDIDECVDLDIYPCQQECKNSEGSYTCLCPKGYVIDAKNPQKCKCNASECPPLRCDPVDTWSCFCSEGFVLAPNSNGTLRCFNIDECAANYCDHICENTFGGFKCSCRKGFRLQEDGTTCEPVGSTEQEGSTGMPFSTTISIISTTSRPEVDGTILTLGALLGIIVGLVVLALFIIIVIYCVFKKRANWKTSTDYKCNATDQGVNLQHVSTGEDPQYM